MIKFILDKHVIGVFVIDLTTKLSISCPEDKASSVRRPPTLPVVHSIIAEKIVNSYALPKDVDIEFAKMVSAPSNRDSLIGQIERVPIARDKFCKKYVRETFYKKNDHIVHIVQIKNCTIISFFNKNEIEGSVILTEKREGVEVEYGKAVDLDKSGVGEYMLLAVIEHYYLFDLPLGVSSLYGEVVSTTNGGFNFGSYMTLLRAGFQPISRKGGDMIKFVLPQDEELEILTSIVVAYHAYEKASMDLAKAKRVHEENSVSFVVGSKLSKASSKSSNIEEVSILLDTFAEKKAEAAKVFTETCLAQSF